MFSHKVTEPPNAVVGIVRVILGKRVDMRGRNRKWFRAGKMAGCMDTIDRG
jgi:hypothetical protein